jgi:VIT1/CCC1 family predicted Fe2+/Mn2+ transporter
LTDTASDTRKAQYRVYLDAELEAAALYLAMAEAEKDSRRADIFQRLARTEMRHASRWAEKLDIDATQLEPASPGLKIRMYRIAARAIGTSRVIPWILRGEIRDIMTYASDPEAKDIARDERRHSQVLQEMASGGDPMAVLRGEKWHRFSSGSNLRAAVLGVNDGLVSNFSLVMGVAGGTNQADFVLLAGVAGLLAGAFSMAAGEYVSVRSQRDVYEYQITIEKAELQEFPEEEEDELALIYEAKGIAPEDARSIAKQIMENPNAALDTMAREELGLDPEELGSPWGAATSSFAAFVAGAIIPILPYIFDAGTLTFILSTVLSSGALLLVGGMLSTLSAKNPLWGAFRMLLAGGAAAAVTFGIGHLIGVSIAG